MTGRHHRRGANMWHSDGRDPLARLRRAARWEGEARRAALTAHLRAWAIASLALLALILAPAFAAVHALGLLAPTPMVAGANSQPAGGDEEGPASP